MKMLQIILFIIFILVCSIGAANARISFASMEGNAVRVGNINIPMARFENAIKLSGEELLKEHDIVTSESTVEVFDIEENKNLIKRTVLQQLIDGIIIETGAKSEGVIVTNSDIREEIDELKKQFPSSSDFHKSIAEQQMTIDDLKKNIYRQLIVEGLQKLLMGRIVVTDEEIEEFYDKNLEIFVQPKKVKLNKISVDRNVLAEEILESLNTDTSFEAGAIIFVERGDLSPVLEKFAFSTKPGTISPIIELDGMYHIMVVMQRIGGKETTLKQARKNIRNFLIKEKGLTAFARWLDDKRFLTEIVINEKFRELIENDSTSQNFRFSFGLGLT